ncbi:LPXTG cell wall anchor domain-containing protein [Rubrobacter marinus]|uniref:LPXTG cell wall anchor domain-containing protein n=1 Tax=Rubrobacter marinus TaxID=2653852 RepID=A0A6G8Q1M4_9ACTN|nr:excalibur calcium-binding domain-containing protein [Rubrobacter marinus]QIN80335.1 LPXTG cell wall anchor domain-containing protein [Rubrobacter marinus]
MRRFMLLVGLCAVLVSVLATAAYAQTSGPSGADGTYNCVDFTDQGQAQEFYNNDPGDTNGLDEDGDGIACESLPTAVPGDDGGTVLVPAGGGGYQYVEPTTPATTTTAATALPATGGPSLALLAGALLVGAGLVLRRR